MVPSASQKRFLTASSADDESPVTKRSKSNQGANADDADDNKENSSGGTTCTDDVVANHGNTDSPDSDIDRNDSSTSALGEASQIEAVTAEQGNGVTEEVHVDTTASSARGRKKSSPRSSMSGVAEAGIIKTIYCENFMCHRKLRVDLNRNVTFIHGQNGSGTFLPHCLCFLFRMARIRGHGAF
jgi:AAA domain